MNIAPVRNLQSWQCAETWANLNVNNTPNVFLRVSDENNITDLNICHCSTTDAGVSLTSPIHQVQYLSESYTEMRTHKRTSCPGSPKPLELGTTSLRILASVNSAVHDPHGTAFALLDVRR